MRNPLLTGCLGGLAATVPMTLAMELMHRRLPRRERYPLPPRIITQRLTRRAGVEGELDETEHQALALASHFAYGATTGGVYGALSAWAERRFQTPRVPRQFRAAGQGTAYGLLVWAGSYLGLLPAAGILTPATRHPARRNALMIAAHVVWGATLGLVVHALRGTSPAVGAPPAPRSNAPAAPTMSAAPHGLPV
jgi:uncharacterized membrane protein YagU involved in acid resistance